MPDHVLVVDDDDLLRRSLTFSLGQAGYRASSAANAEDALALASRDAPDIVLLDIGLPGMDGLDALRHFQDRLKVPVVFVTARRRELDEVLGLQLGADDYVTKPFDLDVLLARLKAVLRRSRRTAPDAEMPAALTLGDLMIHPGARTVTVRGRPLDLPRREFDLLHALAIANGRVVSVEELLARVWGAEYQGESQIVYVHIRWLREKIEDDPQHPSRIITVRNTGYKLETQEVQ
jgi:DNA-binding response OmpR family regulator